ncbi:VUT family protein, partial [Falsihalocynthiibacter arcticus]|uniref:VUT family protein n=1 Tax=Falsihalocynthiibacter arcticus TaxID=1579316 RepID=UPI0030023612
MTRLLPGILAMAATVVASNVLVQFLLGDWLTWGAFTYPIAFLVTDVMNRIYGVSAARRVVFAGFLVGIICSLIGSQIMLEYGP